MKQQKWLWAVGGIAVSVLVYLGAIWAISGAEEGLRLKDFDFLYLGIPLEEIEAVVGPPEPGGHYMYMYRLSDGRYMGLRFSSCDGLQGAWVTHLDKKRQDFFTGRIYPYALTSRDFDFLEYGMPYTKVIENVGESHIEYGMGGHFARYRLDNDYKVELRLGMPDQKPSDCTIHITGAWLVSPDNEEFTPLIELPVINSD